MKKVLNILEEWNGNAKKDSVGASILYVWELKFWESSLGDDVQFDSVKDKLSYFKGFYPEQWLMKSFVEWEKNQNLNE